MRRTYLTVRVTALVLFFLIAATASAVFGNSPKEIKTFYQFDLIEVNHIQNANGAYILDQVIFYDWVREKSAFKVQYFQIMRDARVKTREGEEEWSKEVDKLLENTSLNNRHKLRDNLRYKGDFTGGLLMPRRCKDGYEVSWFLKGLMRTARSPSMIETFTTWDPEQDNKDIFPDTTRRGLPKPKRRKVNELLP